MNAAVAAAQTRGCAEFGLYLVASTENNRTFYEKFGFQAVGTEMRQSF
jgi:GNAT superfamily N-acetyltransferase